MRTLVILSVMEISAMVLLIFAALAGAVQMSLFNAAEHAMWVTTTIERQEAPRTTSFPAGPAQTTMTKEEKTTKESWDSVSNPEPEPGQVVSRSNVLEAQNRRVVIRSSLTNETQDYSSTDVTEPSITVEEASDYGTTYQWSRSAELVWSRHLRMDGDQYITFTIVDSYGDIVAVGSSYDPSAGKLSEFYFVKFDAYGNILAERSFGTPGRDYLGSIVEAYDGYIVVGCTTRTSDGANDIYVAKLDYDGDLIWEKLYGTSGDDKAEFITYSNSGGYLVCGRVSEVVGKSGDYFIMEIDENGDLKWSRAFDLGGDETAYCVREDSDGSYIVCGVAFYKGNQEGFVVKHDRYLNVQWRRTIQGPREDSLFSIAEPSRDGYVMVGERSTSPDAEYPYIVKFSKDGAKLWEKVLEYDGGGALVAVTKRGNVYTVAGKLIKGSFGSFDAYFAEIDDRGNVIGSYVVGGPDKEHFNHLSVEEDGDVILAGWTKSFGAIERDPYLVKVRFN